MKFLLENNPEDHELCHSLVHQLTTALYENQFTTIRLNRTLNRFIASLANRFSINHYDQAITRYMEDTPSKDDQNTNPQLTEKIFTLISLPYTKGKRHSLDNLYKNTTSVTTQHISHNIVLCLSTQSRYHHVSYTSPIV